MTMVYRQKPNENDILISNTVQILVCALFQMRMYRLPSLRSAANGARLLLANGVSFKRRDPVRSRMEYSVDIVSQIHTRSTDDRTTGHYRNPSTGVFCFYRGPRELLPFGSYRERIIFK